MTTTIKKAKAKRLKIIMNNDRECIICRIRKKPIIIQQKPEERYRQRLLNELIEELGYAEENIGVELPMGHFKKGLSGRADIVIFDKPYKKGEDAKPLILIECKDPENRKIDIKEYRTLKTVEKYASVLKPKFLIVTNDYEIYAKDLRNNKEIDHIPSVGDLTKNKIRYIKTKPYEWKRYSFNERFNKKVRQHFEDEYICWKTKDEEAPYILQLMDLIYDTASSFKPTILSNEFTLKDDLSLRLSNYGFAGSGGLIGNYRCLLLEQSDGNSRVIGYSIYPQDEYNGTYLMVSVDARKGHSLELKLDKFIKPTGETTYQIIHSGVMALGHKGRVANSLVLNKVAKEAPFLLNNGKVLLGTFDLKKDLKFQQKEVKDFILRTATYAILRDELRIKLQ